MNTTNLTLSALRPLFVALALCAALPACTSDAEAVCDMKADCERLSDGQHTDCLNEADSRAVEADRLGCTDYYDELKACEAATGYCKSNLEWETNCKTEKDRWEACTKVK